MAATTTPRLALRGITKQFGDRHHVQYLSFLSLRYLFFYFSTAFGIILL